MRKPRARNFLTYLFAILGLLSLLALDAMTQEVRSLVRHPTEQQFGLQGGYKIVPALPESKQN